MNIFLSISKDVTYKKIIDRIGREHQTSVNLKSLGQFMEAMSSQIPDLIIVDKNIDYFANVEQLKGSIEIIVFAGQFPDLMDKLSNKMMNNPVQVTAIELPEVPEEPDSSEDEEPDSESNEEQVSPAESPFFKKLNQRMPRAIEEAIQEVSVTVEATIENSNQQAAVSDHAGTLDERIEAKPEKPDIESEESKNIIQAIKERNHLAKEKGQEEISVTMRTGVLDKNRSRFLNHAIGYWCVGSNGKTVLALNQAIYLGKNMKVLLMDLNLVNPDIADYLNIGYQKGKTLYDAYQAYLNKDLTAETLEEIFIERHGIKVLVGNPDVITQGDFSELFFITLLKTVRQMFDVVIIDMHSDLTAAAGIQLLSYCNRVIIPITTDSSKLVHTRAYMNLFIQGEITLDKVDIVLNRSVEGGKVNDSLVTEAVQKKPIGRLPRSKEFTHSTEEAKPLILSNFEPLMNLCRKIGKPYIEAMKQLDPSFVEEDEGVGFFRKLFKRKEKTL